MVQIEFLKLEEFLIELQKSWKKATKAIEIVQEAMKKQFDKKQMNPQRLKVGDSKNIHSNRLLKKLDQKRYELFRILKDIG